MTTPLRRLATFGYGMNAPTRRRKADVFVDCLRAAGVSLLLDTRDSPWGGFWNPKKIDQLLQGSSVSYTFKTPEVAWHKVFGAPRTLRDRLRREGLPWPDFAAAYATQLQAKIPDPLSQLAALLDREPLVAVMCCEPFDARRVGCHRFVITDLMVAQGLVARDRVVDLDMDPFA